MRKTIPSGGLTVIGNNQVFWRGAAVCALLVALIGTVVVYVLESPGQTSDQSEIENPVPVPGIKQTKDPVSEGGSGSRKRVEMDRQAMVKVYDRAGNHILADCVELAAKEHRVFRAWETLSSPPSSDSLIAVRSPGFVGTRLGYGQASRGGVILIKSGTVSVTFHNYDQYRRRPIHVFLFPEIGGLARWMRVWPAECRARKALIEKDAWSLPSYWEGEDPYLGRWENRLQATVVTSGSDGRAEFRNVIPYSHYRIGFSPQIGLEESAPRIDMSAWGVEVIINGKSAVKQEAGIPTQFTREMAVRSGECRRVDVHLATGRIRGTFPHLAETVRLKLFRRVNTGLPLRQYTEVLGCSLKRGRFVYEDCPAGEMQLQAIFKEGRDYWLHSQSFEFDGTNLDLGRLAPTGSKSLQVRWLLDPNRSPERNPTTVAIEFYFRVRGDRSNSFNLLRTTVPWGVPFLIRGISQDYCNINVMDRSAGRALVKFDAISQLNLKEKCVAEIATSSTDDHQVVSVLLTGSEALFTKGRRRAAVQLSFFKGRVCVKRQTVVVKHGHPGETKFQVSLPLPPLSVIAHGVHQIKKGGTLRGTASGVAEWKAGRVVSIPLTKPPLLRVRLLGVDGRPLSNQRFIVQAARFDNFSFCQGLTDENGLCTFSCLPSGMRWRVFGFEGILEGGRGVVTVRKSRR